MKNYLTIDLEEWHSEKVFDFSASDKPDLISENTELLLKILKEKKVHATFFVRGTVIEKYPELIKKIHANGNEVASHGYSHKSLKDLGPTKFEEEIIRCKKATYKAIKKYPLGFRAPNFSLNNKTKWALPILKKHGFQYDSSIFPYKSRYYGVENAPISPYQISFRDVRKIEHNGITEYPIPIIKILSVPFIISGGFFFRLYPSWFIQKQINKLNNKKIPITFFLHQWELSKIPKIKAKTFSKFVTKYNLKNSRIKFENILEKNDFVSITE